MSSRTRIGTALVMVSFILAAVFAFVPANFNKSTITWLPESGSDSGALQLTRQAPDHLSVETTCKMARAATQPSLLSTGTLELSVVEEKVLVQTSPFGPVAEVSLPPGDCAIRATYTHDSSLLRLSVDDVNDEVEALPPRIDGLYTFDPPAVARVDITTQETGLAPSWGRWTLGLVALAALGAGAALLWLPASRARRWRPRWRRLVPRLAPVDGFVAVGAVLLALITPPLIDDGWIIGRARELQERGRFGELYGAQDAWLPQGMVHELLISVLQSAGLDLAHLRILVALVLALTWVLLRRGVLVPVVGEAASRWPAAAATYLAFVGAWLITVRHEPIVMLLAVLALTVAVTQERSTRPVLVCAGLFVAGLALVTHQTGWVAVAPAAMILWSLRTEILRERSQLVPLLSAVVAAASGLVLVAFAAADFSTILEGASTLGGVSHDDGPLDELSRYRRLLNDSGARVSSVLLLLVWCLVGSLGINNAASSSRRLWILCMVWLGGLMLTASKWEWHFAVYAVPAVCLAALAGVELRGRVPSAVVGTSAALVMVCLTAAVGMGIAGTWNTHDLSSRTWPELTSLILGEDSRRYWYLGLLALAVLGMGADGRRGRWKPTALGAMCLMILFPIGASMAWLVADSRDPGWSQAGSNLRQLTDDDACGVLDGLDIDADFESLTTQPGQSVKTPMPVDAWPHVDPLSTGPLGGTVPAWGTWAELKGSTNDGRIGTFRTPSFQVGDAEEVTVWSAFGSEELLTAEVVFTSASGTETSVQVAPDVDEHWGRLRLAVPEGAVEVRVDVEDENSGFGGWMAVSSPVRSSSSPASSALSDSTGYANPFEATLVPCMDLPDLSSGYWGKVDYVADGTAQQGADLLRAGWVFDPGTLRGVTVTEVACRPDVMCLRKYDYPMANVQVTSGP